MRVVVTGATGNAGTATVEALAQEPEIEEIVGIARRRPDWSPPKTRWVEGDVLDTDLAATFRGCDAVIHLAWAIQPSRDEPTLERINHFGSRRVFAAAATARVPKLVYASSVGAYSPGPKDHEVDESWPTGGTPSSFYSRHKVAVERMLDRFEQDNPDTRVVRLRPALIFRGEAATEIRRLFVGPFLPSFLLRANLVPAVPRVRGLRFQAVHSEDVGDAYRRAVLADVSGPFNVAAEPSIDSEALAQLLGARTFPLAPSVLRALADLSWRLHLQPTPPGWLDMALNVPLMSSQRARRELGWQPRHSAVEALEELAAGMREGRGFSTPPLRPDSRRGRIDEVRTGVGERQFPRERGEQLVKYLTDVHSIEVQALTQMRAAPRIAGEGRIAELFSQHLTETEGHERRVRERLEQLGASPSALKDLAGRGGAVGMVLFAASQPDTPGKLLAHAFSYEHMEAAAYALLERLANRDGDAETASLAREIGEEEKQMASRLEECFAIAVDASLAGVDHPDLGRRLDRYLADAHALEAQAKKLLEKGASAAKDEALAAAMREHLEQTRVHADLVETRLRARGSDTSGLKDAALAAGGLQLSAFFGVQPDTTTKLAAFAYAFEHLEIAAYEELKVVAARAGDEQTVEMAERILADERVAAERVATTWERPDVPLGAAS